MPGFPAFFIANHITNEVDYPLSLMIEITPVSAVLLITTVINAVVCFIGWKRQDSKTGLYFALGMTSITFWTLAAALGYMAVPLELKILFAKFDAIGYNFAIILFFFAVLYFASFEKWADDKWIRRYIFFIPISNILLTLTNELHGWVWSGFTPAGNNITIFEHGPAFTWIAATSYAVIIAIIAILVWAVRKGSAIQRRQARLLLWGTLFPLGANILYLYGVEGTEGVDWSSVTFSITGLFFLRALQSARFIDIIPVARDKLIASLGDGIVVTDRKSRIIDINLAAEIITRQKASSLVGKSIKEVLPTIHAHMIQSPDMETHTEFEIQDDVKQYFDVLITPLFERERIQVGNLIVFRNITERKASELQLQQLSRAVEQSPTSIVITDSKGIITFVNPFFTMLTGYAPSEVIGKNPNIIQSGQTPDKIYQSMWQSILGGQVWDGEFLNKKKNGELYWVHTIMAPVLDANGNTQSFIAIQEDITNRKLAEQTLENRFLEIQTLNKELREAQSQIVDQQRALATVQERQRLGRNLHDSVNQSIHSLMLFSETLIALLQNGETGQAIHAAERIQASGEQALKEVRLLVHESQAVFMDSYPDLIKALENRLDMVERRVGIQADLSYDLSALEYSPAEWMENIYWIVLEGLNNSLKHSQASRVHISIVDEVNQLSVEIKDNGTGFDPSQVGGGGFGMKSMKERVNLLGGNLSIESSPGHGTRVKCIVEIPES